MFIFHRLRSFVSSKTMHGNSLEDCSHEKKALDQLFYEDLDDVQKQVYRHPFGLDGYPIDAWTDPYYETWFRAHQATEVQLQEQRDAQADLAIRPLFSIIVPLYMTPIEYFRTMADSVLAQTFDNFQLVLVNASPELLELASELRAYQKRDKRITVVTLDGNYGITENTNRGISASKGDFCCFLDHDDFLEPNLLFEYASALNENPQIDVLYCDEDLVSFDEKRGDFRYLHPMFKPQISPELLLCKNYVVHLMTVRRTLIDSMPRPDARYDGAQDYNMILFSTHRARKTLGIQKVLYHWRISDKSTAANPEAKPYSRQAYKLSAHNQLVRSAVKGSIVSSGLINIHNIWMSNRNSSVSLVVDCFSREHEIESFLRYLEQNGLEETLEILLLTRKSTDDLNQVAIPTSKCSIIPTVAASRGARLNYGATRARGDYLIFLDSTCSFISPEPIAQLSGLAKLNEVGVTSPKVLYRDGSTKSFGVAVTDKRIMPLHRGYPDDFPAYQCNARAFQDMSACSLQGLCIAHDMFDSLQGFDVRFESEVLAADLCKRVRDLDMRIIATPTVKLEVNEPSPTRPYDAETHAPDFTSHDLRLYDEKWPGARVCGDPYYSANLDQTSPYYQLPRP